MQPKVLNQEIRDQWSMYGGDSCEVIKGIPDNSIGLSVFSPPFAQLYTYSPSERDMGNCSDDKEFIKHYSWLASQLLRITKPGRLCAVHCKDLVDYKNSSGRAGLRDFPGELIRVHEEAGWKYHSRCTVWKCPVTEMQRTKAHGLLYKQLRSDSTFSRMGLAEYILYFRKWADECDAVEPVKHTESDFSLDQWQQWASPVWMDIDQTDVLNVQQARDDHDEKHMCPLQLDLIERVVVMYSNEGDVVFSPFAGIGSEGVVSLQKGRKFVGIELKESYYKTAVRNLANACRQTSIFDRIPSEPTP
jgi:DNA modification methylase